MTKLKNNYVIDLNNVYSVSIFFEFCSETPMHVIAKNGEQIIKKSDFNELKWFPNPGAHEMVKFYDLNKGTMGEKLASTIIEYLDKNTKEPCMWLFPNNSVSVACKYHKDVDISKLLNHASRRDLERQINMRMVLENNKVTCK